MKPKFAIPGWAVQRSDSRDIRQLLNFIEFCNGSEAVSGSHVVTWTASSRLREPIWDSDWHGLSSVFGQKRNTPRRRVRFSRGLGTKMAHPVDTHKPIHAV